MNAVLDVVVEPGLHGSVVYLHDFHNGEIEIGE
jgi:hypothetical protein